MAEKRSNLAPDPGGEVEQQQHLSLLEAAIAWCNPEVVADVAIAERLLTVHQHDQLGFALLGERTALRQPGKDDWMSAGGDGGLSAAWNRVALDMKRKIERGQLFLEGLRLAPERGTAAEEISNSWAAEMNFHFVLNTVRIGRDKFGAITVSTRPSPWQAVLDRPTPVPRAITVQDVEGLDSDVIIALITEHARRVVTEHGSALFPPGMISVHGIVLLIMEERAGEGRLLPSLEQEAKFLAEWIAGAAPSYHVPASNRIARFIGPKYELLSPRSKAAIQTTRR